MVTVRSVSTLTCTLAGKLVCNWGSSFLMPIHYGDDVGAGLALDVDDKRRMAVHPCGLLEFSAASTMVAHRRQQTALRCDRLQLTGL